MSRGIRFAALLALFWVMGLSLGYPTLNRYRPEAPALADASYYAEMVEVGIGKMRDVGHWRYRILVPALARPVYLAVKDHSGSWEPRFLALLVVNAGFCAVTALALFSMARNLLGDRRLGLVAAFLFLLNFNTSNFYLSGLVDSAEVCLLTLILAALQHGRWALLPLLGLLGGAAKETFVAFSGMLAGGWWLAGLRQHGLRPPQMVAITALGVAALGMVLALWSGLSGHLVLPGGVAGSYLADLSLTERLASVPAYLTGRAFWYTFAWLLPLAAFGIRRLPTEWVWAGALSLGGAFFMSVWANAGDNIGRPLFAAVGPIMIIAATAGLASITEHRHDAT